MIERPIHSGNVPGPVGFVGKVEQAMKFLPECPAGFREIPGPPNEFGYLRQDARSLARRGLPFEELKEFYPTTSNSIMELCRRCRPAKNPLTIGGYFHSGRADVVQ